MTGLLNLYMLFNVVVQLQKFRFTEDVQKHVSQILEAIPKEALQKLLGKIIDVTE